MALFSEYPLDLYGMFLKNDDSSDSSLMYSTHNDASSDVAFEYL